MYNPPVENWVLRPLGRLSTSDSGTPANHWRSIPFHELTMTRE